MTWSVKHLHNEESSFYDPPDAIEVSDDGFRIRTGRDGETSVKYDKNKYRIVPDPRSGDGENIERFKFVRK